MKSSSLSPEELYSECPKRSHISEAMEESSLLYKLLNSKSELVFGEHSYQSHEWQGAARKLQDGWIHSIRPGEVCAFAVSPGLEFIATLLALWSLGAVALPLDPELHPERLQARMERAGAHLSLEGSEWQRKHDRKSLRQPGLVLFTSGSSGFPRAALLSLTAVRAAAEVFAARFSLDSEDTFVSGVSPYHGLGLIKFLLTPLTLGSRAVLVGRDGHRVRNWMAALAQERATATGGTNHTLDVAARLSQGEKLKHLRLVLVGGEPLRLSTIRAFENAIGREGVVRPCYGLTECPSVSGLEHGLSIAVDKQGYPCSGRLFSGLEADVRSSDGSTLEIGERGTLWIRGEPLFEGYLDSLEETNSRLKDGWLDTGDSAAIDGFGNLFIYGRQSRMIKRAGTTLAPREVEQTVEEIPGVEKCIALGVESRRAGHDLVLVIVSPTFDSTLQARVSRAVKERIGFGPRRIEPIQIEMIPRTVSGKIDENGLRKLLSES